MRSLKLQGKAKKTIDAYSRAIRRVSKYFDCCPDKLKPEQYWDCVSSGAGIAILN
ncbi:MAG: hypothetical protein JJV92_01275 [Desulfosarcina sp.]|nr:hypothetical protein [Desulfobacterales bacterium]